MGDAHFEYLQTIDGVRLRWGCWPHKGDVYRGSVVVLGGRTEFMEKYIETIGEINLRGFDAFSFDWRGQGFSERMLPDSTRGYIETFAHYVADLELYLEKIVRANCSGPLIVMAHSMGAHIVLHYLHKSPRGIDKAVLLSPMINIRTEPIPGKIAKWYCRMIVKLGKADRNIPALKRRDSFSGSFANNWLTHDEKRFYKVRQLLRENPRLLVSGVTYGWLAASFAAIDAIWQPGFAQRITTPLLVVSAGDDLVVSNDAIRRFTARLPACQFQCIAGAYHEILQERTGLRFQFWDAFDRFVQSDR